MPTSHYQLTSSSPAGVTFNATAGFGSFRVYTDPPDNLGPVDVSLVSTAGNNQVVHLFIGRPSDDSLNATAPIPAGAVNWGGLSSSPGQVVRVQAHVTGDVQGAVTALNVFRLDIGGDLVAPVFNTGSAAEPVRAIVVGGIIDEFGDIQSSTGRIGLVQANGDIDGDVINLNGSIGVVRSLTGFISRNLSGEQPVEVKPYPDIKAFDAEGASPGDAGIIDEIGAPLGGIRADIHADVGIRRVFAGGEFGCKGYLAAKRLLDFDAEQGVGGEIRTPGSFRMATVFSDGIPPKGRIICGQFGRLLEPPATVPDFGRTLLTIGNDTNEGILLQGQIIIDAYNAPTPPMNGSDTAWVANIRIERPGAANDLVLGPGASCPTPGLGCTENFTGWNAEMLPASAALGGGSIGLNRYRVYGTDSVVAVQNRTPVTENVVNGTFSIRRGRDCQTTTVTMRYYGPLLPLGGPRIQVYEQFCGGSGGFISPSSLPNPVISGRTATLTFPAHFFAVDATYTFSTSTGGTSLRCDLGMTQFSDVSADTYTFIVDACAQGDANADAVTNTADLVILLGRFGSSVTGCTADADFDRNGIVNTADLSILLGGFGQECPACSPPTLELESGATTPAASLVAGGMFASVASAPAGVSTMVAATPPGPVLAEMGFVSLEAYTAYLGSLTESQFWQHIAEVLGVIDRLGL
ncbi:MAG: hypothetical protein J0L61_07545 [Planctomycetes bacterium]|nr:hypothetical protein [Planctomycetota bacterium]